MAHFTVEQAHTRYVLRGAPYLAPAGITGFVPDVNIDLGYRYRSRAIDGASAEDEHEQLHAHPRTLAGHPGSRAPHVPLLQRGAEISSIDLLGRRWVLLAGSDASAWERSGIALAHELPLDVHRLDGEGLRDPSGVFDQAHGITPSGAILVRPDAVVAWRAATAEGASPERLRHVFRRLTGAAAPAA